MSAHVVLVHRYFVPDTPPYATILSELAEHLGSQGFQVTVLTCQPSYNRRVVRRAPTRERPRPGVSVVRFPVLDDRTSSIRKVLNLLWFCLRLLGSRRRLRDADVMMAASSPPVLVAATASWLARSIGAAFVYHKQDIYPEVTVGLGASGHSPLARLARAVDSRTDRRAARVVVLSSDMAATVAERGVAPDRILVINNFDPWATVHGAADRRDRNGVLDVTFAGNLGRFQGLETVFEAIRRLRDEPIKFHFFGTGPLSAELVELVTRESLSHVQVHGYRAPDEVSAFLSSSADLGVVSLAPGVIRAAYPSKTMSYLRQGTPILALVEGDSELGRTVRREGIGRQIEPDDVAGVVSALREISRDPSTLAGAPQRARDLYVREYSRDVRLSDWSRLFEELVA